jgi:hypothetical protein
MTVPEAPMNKYDLAPSGENQIRLSWQITAMQAKTIPCRVQQPAHDHLWLRIAGTYPRHVEMALLRR